jgi:cytochrome c-type biogenesis protein
VLGVIGVRTIIVAKAHTCSPHHPDTPASFGGAFLLGGSMALLVSPCCTPIVAALVGFGIASGQLWLGAVTLASFAIGHAVPMIVAGLGAGRTGDALGRFSVPLATVSGSLLIALGAYYGVLA